MLKNRDLFSMVIAALFPSLLFVIREYSMDINHTTSIQAYLVMLMFSSIFSIFGSLIFGLPLVIFLRSKSLLNLLILVCSATLLRILAICFISFIFGIILGNYPNSLTDLHVDIKSMYWGAESGALVFLVYGLIAGVPLYSLKNK